MLSGELSQYWYSATNLAFGTVNIERIIADHLIHQNRKKRCTYVDIYDYLRNLEDPKNNNSILLNIRSALYELKNSEAYYKTWGKAYNHFKSESAWEKVQIFISGGGAKLPFIEEIFSEPWWKHLQHRNVRYPVELLPMPDNYDPGSSNAPFHRMAVAYGLAIPKPALEDYKLPREAPDHTPPKLPVLELDHEDIYLK